MNRRDFLRASAVATVAISVPATVLLAEQDRGIVRYPDPWIEVIDSRLGTMIPFNSAVERLYTGTR